MINEPIVGSSSGFHRLTNHDTRIIARDYCRVDRTKNRSFGAISLNFVAVLACVAGVVLWVFEWRSRERNGRGKKLRNLWLRRSFSWLRHLHIHRATTKPPATQAIAVREFITDYCTCINCRVYLFITVII